MRIKRRLTSAAFALLLLTACTDRDLETLSQALRDSAAAIGILQTAVIQANAQGLLSDDATRTILTAAVRVNEAGLQATAMTRQLNALGPTDRRNVLAVLQPVIGSIAGAVAAVPLGVEPNVRQNIILSLQAIQAALNSAQLALAGTSGG